MAQITTMHVNRVTPGADEVDPQGLPTGVGRAARTMFASVLPAGLFGFVTWARVLATPDFARAAYAGVDGAGSIQGWLHLAHFVLSTLFMGMVAVFLLVRRPSLLQRQTWTGDVAAIAGTVSVIGLTSAPHTVDDVTVVLLASALLIGGMVIMLMALATLGRCFGVMPRARGLVTGGPYRYVQHPMYLGEFIAFAGTLLTVLSPFTLMVYTMFLALQLYRVHCEEQTLGEAFPEHLAYRSTTSRLIPGVF